MTNDYIRREDAVNAVEFGITLASKIDLETGEWTELFQRENDELREAVERIQEIEPADVVPVKILKAEIYKLKCQQDSKNQDYYTGYMSALSTVEGILAEMDREE